MTTAFKAFALTPLFVASSMFALTPEQKQKEERLSPENISKFENEICHLLTKEEDIQTCAEVHKFFAEVLKKQKEVTNGQKGQAALSAAIGEAIGTICIILSLKTTNSDLLTLLGGLTGGTLGAIFGTYHLMNPKNIHNPEEMDAFINYFEQLAKNPSVNNPKSVHNATHIAQLYKNTQKEERFNKIVKESELLEKTPEFERYRNIMKKRNGA